MKKCNVDLQEHLRRLKGEIPFNWYLLIENAHKHMQLEMEWLESLIAQAQKEEYWSLEWPKELLAKHLRHDDPNGKAGTERAGIEIDQHRMPPPAVAH